MEQTVEFLLNFRCKFTLSEIEGHTSTFISLFSNKPHRQNEATKSQRCETLCRGDFVVQNYTS